MDASRSAVRDGCAPGHRAPAPTPPRRPPTRRQHPGEHSRGGDLGELVDLAAAATAKHLQTLTLCGSDTYEGAGSQVAGATRGLPHLTTPRLGQQAFKGLVLTSDHRKCAVTAGKIEPTLQAAHIRPVAMQGQHRVDNGLLLRSDVHTLFDRGYLGIDDKHRLQVSARLRADWDNGQEFYDRAGQEIAVPDRKIDPLSREVVTWHMDTVFLR